MAISWGSWEYGGGNGMRVGIDVDATSVSNTSSSCTVTFKIYTQNQYRYSDQQTVNVSGTSSWADVNFDNNDTGGAISRSTKSYTYAFGSNDYGSGDAKAVTLTASVSGAYNGVTPSKTVTYNIPKRPIAVAMAQSSLVAVASSASVAAVSWVRNNTISRPYTGQRLEVWDSISNAWASAGSIAATAVSANVGISPGRRYLFRISASNSSGTSGWVGTDPKQSMPANPASCTVTKSSVTSVLVSWVNGANSSDYISDTLVEEKIGAGAWTEIAVVSGNKSSYSRTGLSPGLVYSYRVRTRSTVGWEFHSAYATSGTIQLQSPPNAPTIVSIVRTSDSLFTLNWTNNPVAELAPYGSLTVQRSDSSTGGQWVTLASLGPTATSFVDAGTVENRGYGWRIQAENAAGVSSWSNFTPYQTKPAAPADVIVKASPGGAMKTTWSEPVGYSNFSAVVRYFKDGVAVGSPVSVVGGTKQHLLTGVVLTSTYRAEVKITSSVGYSSETSWISSEAVPAATVPNAPSGLSPAGVTVDMSLPNEVSWTHVPSADSSAQTAFEWSFSTDSGANWVDLGKVTSTDSIHTIAAVPALNGTTGILHRVRTWGVHATASPWSVPAQIDASTTPTVSMTVPDDNVQNISRLDVAWSYGDVESQPQAFWEVEFFDGAGNLIEAKSGTGATSSLTLDSVATDGESYVLRVRAWGTDGLKSLWVERSLLADFTPPALPVLAVDYSQGNGTTVLTLTPTPVTSETLPVTALDVQRRMIEPSSGVFSPWETIVSGVAEDAVMVDTVGPIAGDGEYRVIAYSGAPSTATSDPITPAEQDDRWVYLSGGENFQRVVRLMGNIALRTSANRDRSLHYFAGRAKPVLFAGEARGRVIEVSGLLDSESSSPAEWEQMILDNDVMLYRDPLGHRIYGSTDQVSIDFLGNGMHAIAFIVTEVAYP